MLHSDHMREAGSYFRTWVALIMIFMFSVPLQSIAQETVTNTQVSKETVESRVDEVTGNAELDQELKENLLEIYQKILGQIQATELYTGKADAFANTIKSAPQEAAAMRQQLEAQQADASKVLSGLSEDPTAREIEQYLQAERANEAAESTKLAGIEQQIIAESDRPLIARRSITTDEDAIANLNERLSKPPSPDEHPLLAEARRWNISTQITANNAEIAMLEQELLSQPARLELLNLQKELSTRSLEYIKAKVLVLSQALADARQTETEQVIAESDSTETGPQSSNPLVMGLVEKNSLLREELQGLSAKLTEVQTANRIAVDELEQLERNFQTAKQRIELAGLSRALGHVLHEQRRELLETAKYREQSAQLSEDIANAGLYDIRLNTEWRELEDVPAYVESMLAGTPHEYDDDLTKSLIELAGKRRNLLNSTLEANRAYLRALTELDFELQKLQTTAAEFESFLVRNLLWVRNKKTISLDSLRLLPAELARTFDPESWLSTFRAVFADGGQLVVFGIVVFLLVVVFLRRKRLRQALVSTASPVGKPSKDSFKTTMRAAGITVLLAMTWPALIFAIGWQISHWYDAAGSSHAIGASLQRIALVLLMQRLLSLMSVDNGLAEAHFQWPKAVTVPLGAQSRKLLWTFILPAFVMLLSLNRQPDAFGGELARLAFVFSVAGLGLFLFHLLKPETGIFSKLNEHKGYSTRFMWLWMLAGISTLAFFAAAALAGYLYSTLTLMVKLIHSLWLLFGLVVARELVSRWLLVLSEKLNLKTFRDRRDALIAARKRQQAGEEGGEIAEDPTAAIEEPPLDVASISSNTANLVRFVLLVTGVIGLGAIWSSVLPALSVFQNITIWEFYEEVSGQQQLVAVTLADLLVAIVYLLVTVFAAKSIPSLIKALLSNSTSITTGSRVAFATLARYLIVILGVSLIASTIGWNWGRIQWLIAALGVGIGFGLQEIIANFISGIIILVERPIRVGDLITVGDASGTVTRFQIRATTIRNFDGQELLVPNKEFITGRVLNWSLSDDLFRIVTKVGVAYGTDMDKALELVAEAAKEQKLVLSDPPPLITFTEFGDNALLIIARCYISTIRKRREILSDLNLSINKKLNDAGIVVAFPQRDVHLATKGPIDVRLQTPEVE